MAELALNNNHSLSGFLVVCESKDKTFTSLSQWDGLYLTIRSNKIHTFLREKKQGR